MNDISLLNGDKAKYNEMKDAINRVIRNLEDAVDDISSASRQIATSNCINEERADGNKVEAYKNNLVSHINWLKNTILPAIEKSISSCNSQIDEIMSAMMTATAVTAPIVGSSIATITQTQTKSSSVSLPKGTVNNSKSVSNKTIKSNTSVNKMQTKTTVKTSSLSNLKKGITAVVNSIMSGFGSLFK